MNKELKELMAMKTIEEIYAYGFQNDSDMNMLCTIQRSAKENGF